LTGHGLDSGPVITLTVDDCWKTHAHAFNQAFDSMSLRGVFYVIAGFVEKEVGGFQFVEWDALRQMSAVGHEIGSHSFTHRGSVVGPTTKAAQLIRLVRNKGLVRSARLAHGLLGLAEEYPEKHLQQDEEVAMSKMVIEREMGRPCKSYSYPGGEPTSTLMSLARDTGYTSARTTRPGFNYFHHFEPYALRCQVWDEWTTARIANKWVDKAIDQNLWLIEVFHAMNLPGYPYSCSESALKEHLSHVRSKQGKIVNLTVSETIEQMQRNLSTESVIQTVS
jgi:peptidoglycan/xylan/chitin deacetylase (PgdA/CDA1 family)